MTEQYGGLGRAVYVSHGFGRTTVYGHLSRVLVVPGQRIERGETIGLVGNTGRSTGYHLHYEVQVDGDAGQSAAVHPRRSVAATSSSKPAVRARPDSLLDSRGAACRGAARSVDPPTRDAVECSIRS